MKFQKDEKTIATQHQQLLHSRKGHQGHSQVKELDQY